MRADRRHHAERALRRQRRILDAYALGEPTNARDTDSRILNAHIRCHCFECPAERHAERRRARREWESLERDAS